jgi:hypothetical protein
MHNIIERPIAVSGKVEIHPMMYVALHDQMLMVKSLLVSVAGCASKLETQWELLLDNDPKKAFAYVNSILKYLKSCLSNQAGFLLFTRIFKKIKIYLWV